MVTGHGYAYDSGAASSRPASPVTAPRHWTNEGGRCYHGVMKTSDTSLVSDDRLVSNAEIRRVAAQIVACASPLKIILFGSYASGHPDVGSDIDLLVVTEGRGGPDASLKIRRAIDYSFALDIIVCDLKRLNERIEAGDFFLEDAVSKGKMLYEKADG